MTVQSTVRAAKFRGLAPGVHTFTITAHNELGEGTPSRPIRLRTR